MKTVLNYQTLMSRIKEWSKSYADAKPFPHIVLDSVVDEEALKTAVEVFPSPEDERWFNRPTGDKYVQAQNVLLKLEMPDIRKIPDRLCAILFELNAGPFLDFMEALTGIKHLVTDPHFYGAGLHQILPGGKLDIHVDHNINERLNLYRRASLILYLNRDWKDEYGGGLELWSAEMNRCVKRITPNFGRIVIFSNSETSFHGHPTPLSCPPGFTRKSLATWYLSPESDPSYSSVPHKALFMPRNVPE